MLSCPECGEGTVELVIDGFVSRRYALPAMRRDQAPVERLVSRPFGACNRCEFCIEISVDKGFKPVRG